MRSKRWKMQDQNFYINLLERLDIAYIITALYNYIILLKNNNFYLFFFLFENIINFNT